MQFSPIRTAIIAFVALMGVLFAVPSFLPENVRDAWPGFLPKQTVVLGLDLQGGSHLLLQVNEEGIVSERLQGLRRDVRNTLANQNGIGNLITTDEATNSLDANNEKLISENLENIMVGKTALIIAHRLSTIKNAHKIIVLDKGKVVEQGTHQELISTQGKYYDLIINQLSVPIC